MITFYKENKKIIYALLLSVIVLSPIVVVVQGNKFVQASGGFPKIEGLDKLAREAGARENRQVTLQALDKVAFSLAQKFINRNIKSVVNWAYTGFQGKPQFVQNLDLTYQDIASKVFKSELEQYAHSQNANGYSKKVILALVSDYTGKSTNPNKTKIDAFIQTSLLKKKEWSQYLLGSGYSNSTTDTAIRTQNLKNFWVKYSESTKEGGNLLSEYIKVKGSIDSKIRNKQQEMKEKLALNNGYIGQEECLRAVARPWQKGVDTRNAGEPLPVNQTQAFNILKDSPYSFIPKNLKKYFGLSIAYAQTEEQLNLLNDFYLNPSGNKSPQPTYNPSTRYTKDADCAIYATTLPGAMVENMFKRATDQPLESAQKVDTWYELLSSTMVQLSDEITKQGTSLGVNWARKEVSQQADEVFSKLKTFSKEKLQELLAAAPESYNSNIVIQDAVEELTDLSQNMSEDQRKCLKEAGVSASLIKQIQITYTGTDNFTGIGEIAIPTPSDIKAYSDLQEIGQTCGFNKILLVWSQIELLSKALGIINETIPYVRKLDVCIPGPDKGWETRFAKAYANSRDSLTAKVDEAQGAFGSEKDASGNTILKITPYQQYAEQLDSGFEAINTYMQKRISVPVDIMTVSGSRKYKSLIDQSDTLFAKKKEIEGLLGEYTKIYDRLVAIKQIWITGKEPETNADIGPNYLLKLLEEVNSYAGYTQDNKESQDAFNSTIDYLTSLIESNKKCINERNESTKYLGSGYGASPQVYALYKNINPSAEIYSKQIKSRIGYNPLEALPGETQDVFLSNAQIQYLETLYGSQRGGADEQVFYNGLIKSGAIKIDTKLIDGSKDSVIINSASVTTPNGPSIPYLMCQYVLFGTVTPGIDLDGVPNPLPTEDDCRNNIIPNSGTGQTVSTGGGGSYTSGGEYSITPTVNNSIIEDALKNINLNGSLKQLSIEANDTEYAYYCAGGFLSSQSASYVGGLQFGTAPSGGTKAMVGILGFLDSYLKMTLSTASTIGGSIPGVGSLVEGIGNIGGAVFQIKDTIASNLGRNGVVDSVKNPPNKYFKGLSCSNFYSSASSADYDPSVYNASY